MRVVERFVDHGAPIAFRDLCARVLDEQHNYLILDLDKTTHLGRNLGELLAWELCAYEVYGESEGERPFRRWFGERILLDVKRPILLVRYLTAGAKRWAWAGMHYLIWGKLAPRVSWLRRLAYSRFGSHPTSAVQRRPQMVALAHLEAVDESVLRALARRVWNRQSPDQVISRAALEWVRARAPGIRIILSSASPKAMLDVAVEELGADGATYSTLGRINSGTAKIERLREIDPRIFDSASNVLAMTDTSYGEDHCWAEHFAVVVDINSPTPFSAIVPQASPVRAVHSATVLTHEERGRRSQGEAGYLDARRRRRNRRAMVVLDGDALEALLGDLLIEINAMTAAPSPPTGGWELAHALAERAAESRARLTVPWSVAASPTESRSPHRAE